MALTKEQKSKLIEKYARDPKDTGSPEVQIAILTEEIKALTLHLNNNKQDKGIIRRYPYGVLCSLYRR